MNRIDPAKIIQQRLAAGIVLDKYAIIMNTVRSVDVSADTDFQRVFNGFIAYEETLNRGRFIIDFLKVPSGPVR